MTPVVFMSHPVAAYDGHPLNANIKRAVRWYAALRDCEPTVAFTAPWLLPLWLGLDDDGDIAQRRKGIAHSAAIAAKCDGIVLCGGRISTGMQAELDAVLAAGGWVADLTGCGANPPPSCFAPVGSLLEMGRGEWARRMA